MGFRDLDYNFSKTVGKNRMNNILENKNYQKIAAILLLGLLSVFGAFIYRDYRATKNRLDRLGSILNAVSVKPVESTGGTVKSWSELQPIVKDTVVQIFSHRAELNLLEPYKTPNQGEATGSGFFINDKGEIVTNAHVIDQAKALAIQIPSLGKRRFVVEVIGASPERDLALLKLSAKDLNEVKKALNKIPVLSVGNSDFVRRSDEIMTLGYPLGQQALKSTTGVVSGREQQMIQISAAINPGNSGGPSLNLKGEVIGVNTSIIVGAQNVGYIIPSNEVALFLKQLEAHPRDGSVKLLRKPYLGILYNNASEDLTTYLNNPLPGGLYVVEAIPGSPLYKAGIKSGDMIYEIDGYPVDLYGDLTIPMSEDKLSIVAYVSKLVLGDNIHIVAYRNGKKIEFNFKFGESELSGIKRIFPGYEEIDYEVVGGMVIMQLTLNHVMMLKDVAPEFIKYMDPKNQFDPALVITHVLPDSSASRSRALGVGAILSEVNGKSVKTLQDFRDAIKESKKTNYLTIKTSEHIFAAMPFDILLKDEIKLSSTYFYPVSKTLKEMLDKESSNNDKKA